MDLKEQIKMILDEIRPQFETLGEYGFGGIGTPDLVTSSFIDVYESYAEDLIDLVRKGFSAGVYTQTTDVEGEVNGLMTYDRKVVKLDVDRLSKINRTVIESL